MGKELLLEIGTEEIPAAFLPKALKDMEEIIRKELAESRILHGEIRTMGTPRRLFLTVAEVAERQEDQVIEKLGPACRVAFDAQGNPSPAALGFCRGQGIDVSALETATTGKGKYLCARKKIIGEATEGLLPAILMRGSSPGSPSANRCAGPIWNSASHGRFTGCWPCTTAGSSLSGSAISKAPMSAVVTDS